MRKKNFLGLAKHAWFKRHFKKLSQRDIDFCLDFIEKNNFLTKAEFELKANKLGLDDPEFRSRFKDISSLVELLLTANNL